MYANMPIGKRTECHIQPYFGRWILFMGHKLFLIFQVSREFLELENSNAERFCIMLSLG